MENSLVVISETQLRTIIVEVLSDALNSYSGINKASKPDEYLNYNEAIAFLKVSKPTFSKIRSNFNSYKPSKNRVLFKKSAKNI